MNQSPSSLLKEISYDHRIDRYKTHNRLIPQELWEELKARKNCDRCNIELKTYRPFIHHKIPVSKGGENIRENLEALCVDCHAIADKEADPIRRPKHITYETIPPYSKLPKAECPKCGTQPIIKRNTRKYCTKCGRRIKDEKKSLE